MPLYDYRCPVCGTVFEAFFHTIALADAAVVECPKCRVTSPKRLMSKGMRFSFGVGQFFEPYVDTDIHPDGKPIRIESQQAFFKECEKHGRGYRAVRDKLR